MASCHIISKNSKFSTKEQNTHTVRYRLKADSDVDPVAAYDIGITVGPHYLPKIYAEHWYDPGTYCTGVDFQPAKENEFQVWTATATFATLPPGENKDDDPVMLPWLRPAKFRLSSRFVQETVTTDKNGDAIQTHNKELVPNLPTRVATIAIMDVEKNFRTLAEIFAIQREFSGKRNNASFYGYSTGQCTVVGVKSSQGQREGQYDFYTGYLTIECDPTAASGATTKVESRGFIEIPDILTGKKAHIVEDGVRISQPAWISTATGETSNTPQYIDVEIGDLVDFATLGIGS